MARNFNGSTDQITCGTSSTLNPPAMSWSAWIMLTTTGGSYEGVISRNFTGDFFFGVNNGTPPHICIFLNGAGISIDGGTTVPINQWCHIGCSYDSVKGGVTYLNGVVSGSVAASGTINSSGVNTFYIGSSSSGDPFAGLIADAAVWNISLTAQEFAAMAGGVRPSQIRQSGLIGWWPLDGIQSVEPDWSGNGNNGTLTGTTPATGYTIPYKSKAPLFSSAAAAAVLSFGWNNRQDDSRFLPVSRLPDQGVQWFVRSPNPVPTIVVPRTGENRERDPPPVRRPDEPFTWFVQSPNPVPTVFWSPPLSDREKLPPIKENPDPAKQWFVRSPNPVPTTWLPTAGERERLPPVKENPDEPKQWFVQSPNPVPTIFWSPPLSDREKLPPVKENPDPAKQWFVQSPNPVPTTWLPKIVTENRERAPLPYRLPDEPFGWFRPSQAPVPTVFWSPPLSDREKLPPIKENPDPAKTWFYPSQIPVPQRWQPTAGGDVDHLIRIPDQYYVGWAPQQPTTAVNTNAGIPYVLREEQRLPPIKLNPDEAKQWFVRSPNPVPTTWLPTAGETEHPFPVKRSPDEPPGPWFVQSPNPVPTTWLPKTGEDVERIFPIKLNPDEAKQWFVQSSNPVPTIWLPQPYDQPPYIRIPDQYVTSWAAKPFQVGISGISWWRPYVDVKPPIPKPPDEPLQWFVPSPNPVPTTWLPSAGTDREKPPALVMVSDQYRQTWAPHGPYVVTFQVFWSVPLNWITGGAAT